MDGQRSTLVSSSLVEPKYQSTWDAKSGTLKRHANMGLVPFERFEPLKARCRGSHQNVCDLAVERGKKEFPLKHSAVLDVYHGENGLRSLGINIHSAHQRHK